MNLQILGLTTLITISISILGLWLFRKLGILDKPRLYVQPQRNPVPTVQGIFVILIFSLILGIFFPDYFWAPKLWGLHVGISVILITALIDQYIGIPSKIRLLVQIAISASAIFFGDLILEEFILQDYVYHIPYGVSFVFSLVWFLIFMNAINRFDGVYGLASGVSTIGYLTVIILIQRVVIPNYPYIKPEDAILLETITNLSRILFVISFVYTVIEFKPLGLIRDAGTLFYGFTLAYLALLGGAKIGTFGVVFSLVIFDAIRVSINRIFVLKKSPFKGDYTHLHHRLLANGRTRGEIRAFVRIWTSFLMILMILQSVDRVSKIIIFLCMALIFFGVHIYLFRIKKLPNEFKMRK